MGFLNPQPPAIFVFPATKVATPTARNSSALSPAYTPCRPVLAPKSLLSRGSFAPPYGRKSHIALCKAPSLVFLPAQPFRERLGLSYSSILVPSSATIFGKDVFLDLDKVETKADALAGFSDELNGLLFERENF